MLSLNIIVKVGDLALQPDIESLNSDLFYNRVTLSAHRYANS